MNRDYPLASTPSPDGGNKKKMARQEDRKIRKEQKAYEKAVKYDTMGEPRVTKRDIRKFSK